VIFKWTGYH